MKTIIASFVISLLLISSAQQTNAQSASGTTNRKAANPARSTSSRTNPNNGTNGTTGLNGTLEQNSAGTISSGAPAPTTTDHRSSTTTTGGSAKARTKRNELVNLKPNH